MPIGVVVRERQYKLVLENSTKALASPYALVDFCKN
jgi:hypothetical protein